MNLATQVDERDARSERDRELRDVVQGLSATVDDLVERVLSLLEETD